MESTTLWNGVVLGKLELTLLSCLITYCIAKKKQECLKTNYLGSKMVPFC